MVIGVLDIQGSVEEHFASLKKCGVEVVLAKKAEDFEDLAGLIIPGGESTTIGKLLRKFELRDVIVRRVSEGMALWGTCAGTILMAKEIEGEQKADTLGLMDVTVLRNAYGRQMDSMETEVELQFLPGKELQEPPACANALAEAMGMDRMVPAVFIRAPEIVKTGNNVEVLCRHSGKIVAAKEGKMLVTTFHPELTDDLRVHSYFVEMARSV